MQEAKTATPDQEMQKRVIVSLNTQLHEEFSKLSPEKELGDYYQTIANMNAITKMLLQKLRILSQSSNDENL